MHPNRKTEFVEEVAYPATTAQLIEEYGDRTLELAGGDETVAEVLGRLEGETFETPTEARHALYGALSDAAIGRKEYSDRDPTPPGGRGPDQLSF